MELDDKICLCFGVSKRKVLNFIRIEKPKVAGQLSECFGAGTGCGWCRTYLKLLFDENRERERENGQNDSPDSFRDLAAQESDAKITLDRNPEGDKISPGKDGQAPKRLPTASEYSGMRKDYIKDTGNQPPPNTNS